MTHLQQYKDAGKTLMSWVKENPPENVIPSDIYSYREAYLKLFMVVEKELYRAYEEKEIDLKTYTKKCEALDEIDKEVTTIMSKKEIGGSMPPSLEAIIKMLRDKGGDSGGFIIFGGGFP